MTPGVDGGVAAPGDRLERIVDGRRIEQHHLGLRRQVQRVDPFSPQFVQLRRGPVGGDPLDDCGRLDQRVVGPERHGAVTGSAPDPQPPPRHPLLRHVDRDRRRLRRSDVEPAVLGEHVVRLDGVTGMIRHPLRAVVRPRFLVGNREEDQIAARTEPGVGEVPERDGHGCGEVQHVDRAPAPDLAVDELAAEGVVRPARPGSRARRPCGP